MLKIELPGSNILFWVEDKAFDFLVEKELYNTFYPYAAFETNLPVFFQHNDVFVCIDDKIYIEVCHRTLSCPYKGIMHAYKSVFAIIRENLQLQDNYAYIHGAAIIVEGYGFLLLAETGIGKSTLSVYMEQEGGGICLTDDLIIVQKETRSILPVSKYAHIRIEGKSLFKTGESMAYNHVTNRYNYLLSEKRFNRAWPIDCVLVLHRCDNKQAVLPSPMPMIGVLDNMFLPYQIKNNINSAITISNAIPIFDMYYNNLEQAKKLMLSFDKKSRNDN